MKILKSSDFNDLVKNSEELKETNQNLKETNVTLNELKESNKCLNRALEDIGWINLNKMGNVSCTFEDIMQAGYKNEINRCKLIYSLNPLIGHWVNLTTCFTFGKGITEPKSEEPTIQDVITEFWNNADNVLALTGYEAQKRISDKLQVEGNLFFLFFVDDLGNVKVRLLDTIEVDDIIRKPDDRFRTDFYKTTETSKRYDFHSDQFVEIDQNKIIYYQDKDIFEPEQYDIPEDKLVENAFIYHVKANVDFSDKFGIPDIYRGLPWAIEHKASTRDAVTYHRAASQYAAKKNVKGSQAKVNTIVNQNKGKTDLTNFPQNVGATHVSNDGISYDLNKMSTGQSSSTETVLKHLQLMISAASGIFLHYFGDPSTGNLATAKSMELPMLKKFEDRQQLFTSIYNDILQFLIDQKITARKLQGKVIVDTKNQRYIYETDLNRTIDIDFPPILETDLKEYAESLVLATTEKFISRELGAEMYMKEANVNNIDEEKKRIESQKDESELNDNKDNQSDKKNINESIDVPGRTPSGKFVHKQEELTAKINGYRNVLAGHFFRMKEKMIENIKTDGPVGEVVGNIFRMEAILGKFEEKMKESGGKYYPQVAAMGFEYTRNKAKTLGVTITESLKEADVIESEFVQSKINWNNKYISTSLVPDIRKKVQETFRDTYESEEQFRAAMNTKLTTFESRMEQYVGALWHVEESSVKEAGKDKGLMVNFVGADDEGTCIGCENALAGNPWKMEEAPEPGTLNCLGRCRHALQIIGVEGDV